MTKEDLQQIRELLQEQKQDLTELMDAKLQEQKQEIIQECTANMNVIIESEVTPKFNLLADEIANIKSAMATKEQLNDLEARMDDRFDVLEAAVKYHGNEITRLKKAL